MDENKTIKVSRVGGSVDSKVNIIPGETVDQFIPMAARDLGLDENGSYYLLGQNQNELSGDLYKQVKDGDSLTLAQKDTGGAD